MGNTGAPYHLPWPELPDVADGPDAYADLAKATAVALASDKSTLSAAIAAVSTKLTSTINANKTTASNENNALKADLQENIDTVSTYARSEWYHTVATARTFAGHGSLQYVSNTIIPAKPYLRFAIVLFRGLATALATGHEVELELRENTTNATLALQHVKSVNLSYGAWAVRAVAANAGAQFDVMANASGAATLTGLPTLAGMNVILLARE